MSTITIKLLDTKNSVLVKDNQVYYNAPNGYVVVQGENNATDFKVEYNESKYANAQFIVKMINARNEAVDFELNDKTSDYYNGTNSFKLLDNMTYFGYTRIYITAIQGDTTTTWSGVQIKVLETASNYSTFNGEMGIVTKIYIDNALKSAINNALGDIGTLLDEFNSGNLDSIEISLENINSGSGV